MQKGRGIGYYSEEKTPFPFLFEISECVKQLLSVPFILNCRYIPCTSIYYALRDRLTTSPQWLRNKALAYGYPGVGFEYRSRYSQSDGGLLRRRRHVICNRALDFTQKILQVVGIHPQYSAAARQMLFVCF